MDDFIYLDHAAATPMDPQVLAVMQPYFSENFFNPSATYLPAVQVRKDVEAARARMAHWLGARSSEIVYTAGGTEANNLAIRGVMDQFPDGKIIVSAIEHESVLQPAYQYDCHEVPVLESGIVDVNSLVKLIDDDTVLVSVMYANNEVGTIQPIRQIAQELDKVRAARRKSDNKRPLYFHTDAAQATNYLDLHTARLGVDMMTINGSKMYGPKQCGALFVSSRVNLKPQILGGGQERGVRSGTENVAGIIGMSKALDMVQGMRHDESVRLQKLQKLFFDLLAEKIPQAVVNGSRKNRLPNNVHVTIPGQDNERLLIQLETEGILCAAGSACSASSHVSSHVLKAMGLSDADARASLRFTLGHSTNETVIKKTVDILSSLVS